MPLCSCSHQDQETSGLQAISSSPDSWYHPAPENTLNSAPGQELKFIEVDSAFETQAEQLLASQSEVLVSAAQAEQFSGGKYHGAGIPFLVRAVCLNKETGAFEVVQKGAILFVSHSSLGHSAVPMKRQVLIVDLLQAPRNVYVDCSMAE